METSTLSSLMEFPREGHLKELFHVFYLPRENHNSLVVFDPTDPEIDLSEFTREYWSQTAHGECMEELTPKAHQ